MSTSSGKLRILDEIQISPSVIASGGEWSEVEETDDEVTPDAA